MGPCPFMVWLRRVVVVVALQGAAVCQASVVVTGDVSPDPTTTTLFDNLYIGFTGHGTLTIDDGSTVQSANGYLGYWSDSTGHVTVDGVGSTWINNTELFLGGFGDGTLVVTGGGAVGSTLGFIGVGSTGRVTVDGHGSSWTNTWDLLVGDGAGGEGTLEITSGGEVSNSGEGFVAYGPDSIGVVTIDGVGSTWTNDGDLVVGSFGGEGLLEITGGGAVSSISGSIQPTGHVIADGAGSAWSNNGDLFVGGGGKLEITGGGAVSSISSFLWEDHATAAVDGVGSTWTNEFLGVLGGTLEITGGGEVSNTWAHIGNGSTARVTVAGAGSRWTNDNALLVGESNGDGTLEITGGGAVSSYLSHIGLTASSTGRVTINGPGSEWTNTSELFVGSSGEGALEITGGGTVNNQSASVAYSPNSVGVVTVDGAGSTWTNEGNLVVGERGHGSLEITGGGAVAVENELYISHFSGGAGSVQVDEDSRLNVGQRIHLHQGGTLQLTDGGVAVVGALPLTLLDNTLHVGIDGTLSGSGTILGDVLVDGGVVSPGFSPGKLDVVGNYLQGSFGSLDLEIGGLLPGQYDQLSVTGNLSLAGTVNIAFIDGFLPSVGDQFDFFQVGGTFDLSEATLQWNNAPAGFQYNSAFQDGLYSVHITAVPEPSTLVLAACGALGILGFARRRISRP